MGLGEKSWGGMDWIYLAQDRDHLMALVNTVMYCTVFHKMLGTYSSSWVSSGFSWRAHHRVSS
jgi:hypothetical protein